MNPSRSAAFAGARTPPAAAWRSDVASALAVVVGRPRLWAHGALAFSLRGGLLLLTLPMIVLPTQVEVRLALGDRLASTGLTTDFWSLIAWATVISSIVVVIVLGALAQLERAMFGQAMADPESAEQRHWRQAAMPSGRAGRVLTARLFVIQGLALVCLALCAAPLAAAVGQVTLSEILRPSSSASIYLRVMGQVLQPLLFAAVCLVVIEAISAMASRAVLTRAAGLAPVRPTHRGVGRFVPGFLGALARGPARSVATAMLGWLLAAAVLAPAIWAIGLAWQAARASFLATVSTAELVRDPSLVVVAALLALVVLTALVLAGFVSAVRATLWSIGSLR